MSEHPATDGTDAVDDAIEYGFEPSAAMTGADDRAEHTPRPRSGRSSTGRSPRRRTGRRAALRRRLSAVAVLVGALGAMGGAYAAFATSSGASDTGSNIASSVAEGHNLYTVSCITCHGENLSGVNGNGPSLIGVGSAAVYFQVSTGRMPLTAQGAYAATHPNKFTEAQTEALGAYVESVGGGPSVPSGNLLASKNDLGEGGEMFRLNCASCHGVTLNGAPLSEGAVAPSLNDATPKQMYAAMLSGPANMPVFSDNTITPHQKKEIIAYIHALQTTRDPGGDGIDRIGPVSEAIVIWVAGVGALMVIILWIGARAR